MVQGIAHGVGDSFGPLFKLFPIGGVLAGAEPFVDAVGTHGPPFVVVAFQPDLSQVVKTPVVGNESRVEVAVVVDDGLRFGVLVVERLRDFVVQQEVIVHECFHRCRFRG